MRVLRPALHTPCLIQPARSQIASQAACRDTLQLAVGFRWQCATGSFQPGDTHPAPDKIGSTNLKLAIGVYFLRGTPPKGDGLYCNMRLQKKKTNDSVSHQITRLVLAEGRRVWRDTSPAGGEEQQQRPHLMGLGEVRASLQRLLPSLLGPERPGKRVLVCMVVFEVRARRVR